MAIVVAILGEMFKVEAFLALKDFHVIHSIGINFWRVSGQTSTVWVRLAYMWIWEYLVDICELP